MDQTAPEEADALTAEDLDGIIGREGIVTHFQPVLSLKRSAVLGFEALSRAVDGQGRLISPQSLFASARRQGRSIEVDRLCRDKAILNFRRLEACGRNGQPPLLFLNFDTALLDQGVAGSGFLRKQVADRNLSPRRVVIEIVESRVNDVAALSRFIRDYRDKGFLIALDDVGVGYSNLDRIPLIRPDILKVDRSLIEDIHRDHYKQEIVQALVRLSHKTGTLVLAEGLESLEECLCVLNHDIDLLQGYYFSRPCLPETISFEALSGVTSGTAACFRERRIHDINVISRQHRTYQWVIEGMKRKLASHRPEEFSEVLERLLKNLTLIEAVYVLDGRGVMVTDTLFRERRPARENPLFREARRGDNLSLKDYFYLVMFTGLQRYVTDSYISWATGNLTKTISSAFRGPAGEGYVLCIDVREDDPSAQEGQGAG